MYTILLYVHSWNRWFVLIAFATSLLFLIRGSVKGGVPSRPELALQQAFVGLLDLQFTLGLGLLVVTPLITGANIHPWIYHHAGGMIMAIATIHAANSISKKKSSPIARRKTLLIGNLLGFFLLFGSLPWPFMNFARPLFRF